MLYVFTGSDTVKANEKALSLSKGHEVVRFGEGGESFESALSHLGATSLFAKKVALILDRPLETEEGKSLLTELAHFLVESEMLVIVIELEISSQILKNLRIEGAEIETFDMEIRAEKPSPPVFALTDAFASGKRKDAWILYRKLIESGSAPEEIHGALSWQARALAVASKTRSAEESGLKPFVFMKAKRVVERLKTGEADQISRDLMHMVHASRMGAGDLEDLLEAYLLKK